MTDTKPSSDPVRVEPPSGGTGRRNRVTIAIATVAVVLAGTFGIIALANSGGSTSAEDAVRDLFDALDQEDAIGVLAALDPGERETLQPAIEDMVDELQRVDVLSDGSGGSGSGSGSGLRSKAGSGPEARLEKVSGVDLRVKDLQLRPTVLGDGVTSIEVTGGTISVDAAVDDLPLGPLVREVLDRQEVVKDTGTSTADLAGVRLVTTSDDDRWHVSVLYTLAELARHEIDPQPPIPEFGKGTPAVGASSPEEAVRQAITAATDLDIEKLVSLTPTDGLGALHDYAPGFAAAVEGNRSGVTVDGLELTTKHGPDGTKVVTPTAFTMTWTDSYGGTTVWDHAGDCTTVKFTAEPDEYDPDGYESTQKGCGANNPFGSPASFFGLQLVGVPGGMGIVTEQHDGRWYIDPTTTLIGSIVDALRSATDEEARRAVWTYSGSWWLLYPDEMWVACGVERPPADATDEVGENASQACFEKLPEDYTFEGVGAGLLAMPLYRSSAWSDTSESSSAVPLTDEGMTPELEACLDDAGESEQAIGACFDQHLGDVPPPPPTTDLSTDHEVPATDASVPAPATTSGP